MALHFGSLIPNISNRLSAWEEIQQHLTREPAPRVRPTITLSRAFGCEGFVLADALEKQLEAASGEPWNVYDRTLLEAVAKEEGIDLGTLERLGETARSIEKLGITPPEYYAHAEAFRAVARRLVQFATVGNAIIIGRGGAVLCHALTNCFHVRLDASLEWRVKSIEKRLEMSHPEALHLVGAHAEAREIFMREQLQVDPHDRSYFDMTFNNGRHDVAAIAASIVSYVRTSWPDTSYFKG